MHQHCRMHLLERSLRDAPLPVHEDCIKVLLVLHCQVQRTLPVVQAHMQLHSPVDEARLLAHKRIAPV
jgi:hypothetical protein